MKYLLLASLIASCAGFNKEQNFVDIVVAVKQFFYSGCVYILHDDDLGLQNRRTFNRVGNYFSRKGIPLCITTTSKFLHYPEVLRCKYNRPICIVPSNKETVRYLFEKLAGEKIQLSSAVWLLFLDTNSVPKEFFADIDVPFDCEFLVVLQEDGRITLTEVYRVSPTNPLQARLFGNWTADRRLIGSTAGFYERRKNLEGLELKTGTVEGDFIKITKDVNNKPTEISGSYADIWHALERTLNFTSDYYTPEGNWYGSNVGNGTWNGLVGMLMRHEVHVNNVDMTWTADREDVVDFIAQINQVRRFLFVKTPKSTDLIWHSLVAPFSPGLWVALVVSLLTLSLCLWLTMKLCNCCELEFAMEELKFSFIQSLFCAFSAFCSQGCKTPYHTSSRIVFLTTHLTAVIMLTSYSASLISHIMTREYNLPFHSFEEFLEVGTYQLVVEPYSSQIMYFKMSNNSVLREVYQKFIAPIESSLPRTLLDRLEMVCANRKYSAIATERDVLVNLDKLNCTLNKVPNAYLAAAVSFSIQNKSPYREIFKQTLHGMLRTGSIKSDEEKMAKIEPEISSVSLSQVTPILVVLASGIALAIFTAMAGRLSLWKTLHNKLQAKFYISEGMSRSRQNH